MKKLTVLALCSAMALSMAACGSKPKAIDEATVDTPKTGVGTPENSTEDTAPGMPESSAEDTAPDAPENSADDTAQEGGIEDFLQGLAIIAPGEDIFYTGWEFAGGMLNGVEMNEAAASQALETYGGTLQLLFGDMEVVSMVQGGGSLEGSYTVAEDGYMLQMIFENEGAQIPYAGVFANVNDTFTLMLFSDETGLNVLYFTQIDER